MVQSTKDEEPIDAEPSPQATLCALLLRLTNENRLLFKQAVVNETIRFVTQLLPPEDADEGHRCGIAWASRWLADPSKENEKNAIHFCAAERIDGAVRYFDYPEVFLWPAMVAGTDEAEIVAHFALQAALDVARWRRHRDGGSAPEDLAQELATVEHEVVTFQIALARRLAQGT
jgi:hypothetical protein